MSSAPNGLLVLAADVGGRGDNPSNGTGVVTIVVIALLGLVAGGVGAYGLTRARSRRRSLERHPDSAGRVGRVGKMRS